MTTLVRAQALRGFRQLVSDLGGNPTRLLRKAGIDPAALNQLTAFISFEQMISLLERSAAELDCPDFGLRLAERQDIWILGTLAVAMRYSATVGEAGDCASKYLHVHNAAVAFSITSAQNRGQVLLASRVLVEHSPDWAQTAEHAVGLAVRILNMLSEGRSQPQQIWFPHPPVAAESSYRARFDAPLVFEADRPAFVIVAEDLNLPISQHNAELQLVAVQHLERELAQRQTTFRDEVRQAAETLLGTGRCSYRDVANALYIHPRTLQRRLREEGTTFEAIKDETRRDLAERYLSHPDVPLTQVSALLDYSEQSALGRSCRRWFHATPRGLRRRLLSETPALATAEAG
jgi:AraC-like DNA-binding protein